VLAWVTKLKGKQLQFSNRHLHISDRGNYVCSKVNFCPYIPPKWGIFGYNFGIFGRTFLYKIKFSDRLKFRVQPCPSPATMPLDLWISHLGPVLGSLVDEMRCTILFACTIWQPYVMLQGAGFAIIYVLLHLHNVVCKLVHYNAHIYVSCQPINIPIYCLSDGTLQVAQTNSPS